jgi:hypothetical protein
VLASFGACIAARGLLAQYVYGWAADSLRNIDPNKHMHASPSGGCIDKYVSQILIMHPSYERMTACI